jgi:holo-[acyl-carrier protein] synthase
MIIAIGIDLIDIARVRDSLVRSGRHFRDRVFTPKEIEYCEARPSSFQSYAARFAAKEAVMKALGTGWFQGVRWLDIEVLRDETGPPYLRLAGRALELFEAKGARKSHLSLAHSRGMAIAQVVFEQ